MNTLWQEMSHSLSGFYLTLALVSLPIALLAAWVAKRRFSDRYLRLFSFFWILNIIAPVIGIAMTLWIAYYLHTVRYAKILANTDTIDMNAFYSDFPQIQRIFGEASMGQILSSDTVSESMKMKALISLTDRAGKNEIALIKETLSDKNDEIRLYSFAIIDRLERGINNRIHLKLDQYKVAKEGEARAKLAGELAQLYWEMIYFELADEDLKRFIAREVDLYASEALQYHPDDPVYNALLGKCCLITQAYRRSKEYFETLLSLHDIHRDSIVPYLAEIHFIEHRYSLVRELMQSAEGLRNNQLLNPIVELWNERQI